LNIDQYLLKRWQKLCGLLFRTHTLCILSTPAMSYVLCLNVSR